MQTACYFIWIKLSDNNLDTMCYLDINIYLVSFCNMHRFVLATEFIYQASQYTFFIKSG